MTLGSDNPFPSILIVEGSAPAAPSAGDQRVYIDSADHLLKWKDSGSTVRLATGQPLGLTGATSATRFVGGTASGAPASGTFATGDFVIAQNGHVWVCTTGGTPGTWADISGGGGASPLLAIATSTTTFSTANQTLTDVDATNLAPTVTVPASGKLLVQMTAMCTIVTQDGQWGLRDGSNTVLKAATIVIRYTNTLTTMVTWQVELTGLTPGSLQVKWGACVDGASGSIAFFGNGATMTIWAA